MSEQARYGWGATFPEFRDTPVRVIRGSLEAFVRDAGERQLRAWDDSIPPLQREVQEILAAEQGATGYTAILEYELPLESRRTDVILLAKGTVVVLELKGKAAPSQADIDQLSAYARDLRCYHRECADRPLLAVCVPMRAAVQFDVSLEAYTGEVERLLEKSSVLRSEEEAIKDQLVTLHNARSWSRPGDTSLPADCRIDKH